MQLVLLSCLGSLGIVAQSVHVDFESSLIQAAACADNDCLIFEPEPAAEVEDDSCAPMNLLQTHSKLLEHTSTSKVNTIAFIAIGAGIVTIVLLLLFVLYRKSSRGEQPSLGRFVSEGFARSMSMNPDSHEFAEKKRKERDDGITQMGSPDNRGVRITRELSRRLSVKIEATPNMEEEIEAHMDRTRLLFQTCITHDTEIEPAPITNPPANLTFKDVSFSFKKDDGEKVQILEPCSGHFPSGELVAIMGPSGSGKSTLLDMLANKKTAPYEGEVMINGRPRDHLFQRIAAYVGQEDVMPQYWTVRDAIGFNMALKTDIRLPNELRKGYGEKRLDIVLQAFGLDKVADTFVGGPKVRGISGGQRRRVTLARGVASRAMVLFCDEPTSGLSATDAELCVRSLRIMAKKFGVLILVVIHQPRVEVADLFDRLVLLTSNPGRMVYNGSMQKGKDYWKNVGHEIPIHANPTDVFLDLVTPGGPHDHVDEFVAYYKKEQQPDIDKEVEKELHAKGLTAQQLLQAQHDTVKRMFKAADINTGGPRLNRIAATFPKQVQLLFQRKIALTRRDPNAISVPLAVPCFSGLLMGVMFQGIGHKPFPDQLSFIFLMMVRICMSGMQLMPNLMEDRTIMKYDTSEALFSVEAFVLVNLLVDVTLSLIGNVFGVLVMYTLAGMHWKYFMIVMKWAILNFFVFDALFGFIAAYAPSLSVAQVTAIPFNSIFMMFSGFMITRESAPFYLKWVFEVSPMSYAIQGIVTFMAPDYVPAGPMVVESRGFRSDQDMKGIAVMLVLMTVLRIMQFTALKYKNNIEK